MQHEGLRTIGERGVAEEAEGEAAVGALARAQRLVVGDGIGAVIVTAELLGGADGTPTGGGVRREGIGVVEGDDGGVFAQEGGEIGERGGAVIAVDEDHGRGAQDEADELRAQGAAVNGNPACGPRADLEQLGPGPRLDAVELLNKPGADGLNEGGGGGAAVGADLDDNARPGPGTDGEEDLRMPEVDGPLVGVEVGVRRGIESRRGAMRPRDFGSDEGCEFHVVGGGLPRDERSEFYAGTRTPGRGSRSPQRRWSFCGPHQCSMKVSA